MLALIAIAGVLVGYCAREVQQMWHDAREAERAELAKYSREFLAARERARLRIDAMRRLRQMAAKDN